MSTAEGESKHGERSAGDLQGLFQLEGAHFLRAEPRQTGSAFLAYLRGQLFEASLTLAGSPLCLCTATDFTLQLPFQFPTL